MSEKDFALPETHIERMDRLEFEAAQQEKLARIKAERDIKVAKEERKAERSEMWIWVAAVFAMATVICTCAYAWWIDDDPVTPQDYRTSEAGREEVCVNNGGGWIPERLLVADANKGLCVYPGKQVAVPAD